MTAVKILAFVVVAFYLAVIILLYLFQTWLIFYPGKLSKEHKFKLGPNDEEIFFATADDEQINALFFKGTRPEVILYFHGNAGDLSGWQFVAEDFTSQGYSVFIIDYRGYGKSSGTISEEGLYKDAEAAYYYLINKKAFTPQSIIIYGRSIGSGVAVGLASRHRSRGLVLEASYASLGHLANEKFPMFFPGLYLTHKFNSLEKMEQIKCPVIFIHGQNDSLIPVSHAEKLFQKVQGKKRMVIIPRGQHNDLTSYAAYHETLKDVLPSFFSSEH